MMSQGTYLATGTADFLNLFAVIAAAVGLVGLAALNLRGRIPRSRRACQPSRGWRSSRPPGALDAATVTGRAPSSEFRPGETSTVGPAIESRTPGDADLLAELHGVGGLAARARGSRWRKVAREVAVSHIQGLARPDRVIEFDLELGGRIVAATLLTTTGVYAVVVHDRDANDAGGMGALAQLVRHHARALSELARLTGIEPELIVYSPYVDAPARPAYIAGHNATTVGRPASLAALLDRRRGPGLTTEALENFRDAAKPRGRRSLDDFALHAIGRDSPDLQVSGDC